MPPRSRLHRQLSPRVRARVVELRLAHPWLGLRKIAAALKISLHQVRQAIEEPTPPQRLSGRRGRVRCKCGALLTIIPCLACRDRGEGSGARG